MLGSTLPELADQYLIFEDMANVLCPVIIRLSILYVTLYLGPARSLSFHPPPSKVAGIGTTIAIHKFPEYARFHEFKSVMFIWLAFAAAASVVLSGSLTFHAVCCIPHLEKWLWHSICPCS